MRLQTTNIVALGIFAFFAPANAFFRLPCSQPIVTERADPIVDPGVVSGHVHTIMGGNGFGFDMTYNDTQASTCSSCAITKDLSNYWVPTLYYQGQDGTFQSVQQSGGVLVYYLQRTDPNDPLPNEGLLAFPEGFRMTAGNPLLRNYTGTLEQQAISYACLGTTTAETNGFPNINCPQNLRAQVFFPSCWNGVDLDSPDHQSHMAYPSEYNSGFCPESHPHRFISIFYEVQWETNAFADMWYGDDQPFVWSFGDPTGYGYHGDFISGWDVSVLQDAVTNCNDDSGVIQDCPVFDNLYFTADQNNGCLIPSMVDEQVFGNLTSLPGCNSVQSGPGLAVAESGCGAVDVIGSPQNSFVDLTQSKGFAYLGCGTDVAFGADRTLTGASVTLSNLTVESCVDYCEAAGFSIAGMEYSDQCYCGNSMTSGRAPVTGLMGACTMPCSGNATENCGGAAYISLYQKCTPGDACDNISYILNSAVGPQPTGISTVSGVATPTGVSIVAASVTGSAASSVGAISAPSSGASSAAAGSSTDNAASSIPSQVSSGVAAVTGEKAIANPSVPTPSISNSSPDDTESTTLSTETLPSATSLTTVFLTSTTFINPGASPTPVFTNTTSSNATASLLPFPSESESISASDIAKAASTPTLTPTISSLASAATACNVDGNPVIVTVTVAMSTVTVEVAATAPGNTGSGSDLGSGASSDPTAISASPTLVPFPVPGNSTAAATGTASGKAIIGTGTGVASASGVLPTEGFKIRPERHLRRHIRGS